MNNKHDLVLLPILEFDDQMFAEDRAQSLTPTVQHVPNKVGPCICGSCRIATLWATAKDNCEFLVPHLGIERQGYTPPSIGLGTGGDGAKVEFCLACGRLQGFTPVSDETIQDVAKNMWEI